MKYLFHIFNWLKKNFSSSSVSGINQHQISDPVREAWEIEGFAQYFGCSQQFFFCAFFFCTEISNVLILESIEATFLI